MNYPKKYIILILFTIIIFSSHKDTFAKYNEQIIGKAILEVSYERTKVTDTLDLKNDFRKDIFNLKISENGSGFYSEDLRIQDSISSTDWEYSMNILRDINRFKEYDALPQDYVYKNFPTGKILAHDRFDGCFWEYTEDLIKFDWEIIPDSVTNIHGFECIFARTYFRGRIWNAWFAPEIPISEGPWKFGGLPGIILQIEDSKKHYSYGVIQIRKENLGNVTYFGGSDIFKTKRQRFQMDKWKAIHQSIGYKILSNAEAFGLKPRPNLKKPDKIPHSNYDLEETDFPHNM